MFRKLRNLAKGKAILKKFGYSYISHFEYNDTVFVEFEGDRQMNIELDDILLAKSASDIERDAEWYSCCGDTLDHDVPMCSSCKEWC